MQCKLGKVSSALIHLVVLGVLLLNVCKSYLTIEDGG